MNRLLITPRPYTTVSSALMVMRLHSFHFQATQVQPTPAIHPNQTFNGYQSMLDAMEQPTAPKVLSHFVHHINLSSVMF